MGKFRLVAGTSFKGHNGLRSISSELGGIKGFTRIGIGIGRPESREPNDVANYVLSPFHPEEVLVLKNVF